MFLGLLPSRELHGTTPLSSVYASTSPHNAVVAGLATSSPLPYLAC
jgi:hypothetical protein